MRLFFDIPEGDTEAVNLAYMQAVHVSAPDNFIGTIATLRIDQAHPNSLAASLFENRQTERAID